MFMKEEIINEILKNINYGSLESIVSKDEISEIIDAVVEATLNDVKFGAESSKVNHIINKIESTVKP